jgi:hypothetical protein
MLYSCSIHALFMHALFMELYLYMRLFLHVEQSHGIIFSLLSHLLSLLSHLLSLLSDLLSLLSDL